ncbi:MAG: S8 family serine peptidase [Pyrinomonadaceae bacterium]|nr:S8 family serine peptidase [Pyrinomonadaceae bacterium]
MATKKSSKKKAAKTSASSDASPGGSAPVEELLLAALERGGDTFDTGRYLATFKEGAADQGAKMLGAEGHRVADARDFKGQAVTLEDVGDAEVVVMPEIGVALLGGGAAESMKAMDVAEGGADSPIESIDPEQFVFVDDYFRDLLEASESSNPKEYLRGFLRAVETIAKDLGAGAPPPAPETEEEGVQALGATWGLKACKVPASTKSGVGIKVAVLDTGLDLGHPDFSGRTIISNTFVGQPVQDLHGHGTHTAGTSTGTKTPPAIIQRYGIAYRSTIFIGKVLTNAGVGSQAGILAGMNWAIANRCVVINMSLGGPGGPFPAYTAAGQAALNNGCLIIAAAGNSGPGPTIAPANSPTIVSVASLDSNLRPSSFSCRGKIEIAGPGRDVFSSWPRPTLYKTISGTSMATPHVTGCGALWAETSSALRGLALRNKLLSTAIALPFPATQVGKGLVQAP